MVKEEIHIRYKFQGRKLKELHNLRNFIIDGRIILKCTWETAYEDMNWTNILGVV
jgi:hypothetical protein